MGEEVSGGLKWVVDKKICYMSFFIKEYEKLNKNVVKIFFYEFKNFLIS